MRKKKITGHHLYTYKLEKETGRERGENSNSNSKILFYKDCGLGLVKNMSNKKSLLSYL